MAAYVIALVRDAWDAEALAAYRRRNTDAVAAHGGRFLARGGEQVVLEGGLDPRRIVIMEFPDREAARGWYEGADYGPLKALRQSASDTDILLVDGV